MKTRTDLLNHLVEKYNLITYLEIGVQDRSQNFDKIICKIKCGVDPDPTAMASCQCTSDEFFSATDPYGKLDVTSVNDNTAQFIDFDNRFDLIFIDGLHTAEQVKKDFDNSLRFLKPQGFIVLHDCNPTKEEHTIVPRPTDRGHWNGDVYKFAISLRGYFNIDYYTINIDNGCLVAKKINGKGPREMFPNLSITTWDQFEKNSKELLNLITWDEFISIGSHV